MNAKKYNLLVFFLVTIIVAISFYAISPNAESTTSADINIYQPSNIDIIAPPSTNTTTIAPTFYTAWGAYNYANKIMTTGEGYYSHTNQRINTLIGLQEVNIYRYKNNKNQALIEIYGSGVENFFEGTYFDGNKLYVRRYEGKVTPGSYPSFSSPIKEYTIENFSNEKGALPCESAHVINNKTVDPVGFSFNTRQYNFTLNFKSSQITSANLEYIKQLQLMSNSSSTPKINSLSINYIVNTTTGYFEKVIKHESYEITRGITMTLSSTSTETFHYMNTFVNIQKPAYL